MSEMGDGRCLFYPTNTAQNGIFLSHPDIIQVECNGPTLNGACQNVMNGNINHQDKNHWRSNTDKDAYFQITLEKGYIYPRAGAILSCYDIDCVYNISIFGIEKGSSDIIKICDYEGKKDEFKRNMNTFPCNYQKPLKMIRMKNRGPNASNLYRIALYGFEFYGVISFGSCTIEKKIIIHYLILIYNIIIT